MEAQYLGIKKQSESQGKQSFLKFIDWENLARQYSQKSKFKVAEKTNYYQSSLTGIPQLPADLQLRDYQQEAVINWFKNRGRGTLKMATGSGKTITALAIATELYKKIGLQILLVICPYRHLVTQWARECEKFNLKPILAFESVYYWQSELSNQLYNIYTEKQKFLTLLTTNSTLITDGFQSQLKFFPEKTLIVGDEAHNLGSPRLEESLPRNLGLRLALSATPERYFDEEGTDALLTYFGEILKPEFTLADALKKGALVHYNYYPILVELTAPEALNYAKLTQRIGWALSEYNNDNFSKNATITSLLMKRSRLIAGAENKLKALYSLMSSRLNTSHTLFYCGDSHTHTKSSFYSRQLEEVTRILGQELHYRVNTYTAETSLSEREEIKRQLEVGELQGLVAIRCLDEGIDIPAIKHAVILASSGNPRQFIQRRGRILRPHLGKEKATLFDMIVMPPELERKTWEIERNLLRKELIRFIEFANLADNATEARNKLLSLQEKYGLLDL
jgi:DNA phosphorothioation system restriction enzyme